MSQTQLARDKGKLFVAEFVKGVGVGAGLVLTLVLVFAAVTWFCLRRFVIISPT